MSDYIVVFLMGLAGVLHCVGMCGGLVMACNMRFGGGFSFSLVYNLGRVTAYSFLGLLMGFLGRSLVATGLFGGFQSVVPVFAGVLMIIIGLDMLGLTPRSLKAFFSCLFPNPLSSGLVSRYMRKKSPSAFILGIFNGFIPCGLLYAVGIKAASTADPLKGMLVMASLGAGTFLPMLVAGSLSGLLGRRASRGLATVSSLLVIALGAKSILYAALPQHVHMMAMH